MPGWFWSGRDVRDAQQYMCIGIWADSPDDRWGGSGFQSPGVSGFPGADAGVLYE